DGFTAVWTGSEVIVWGGHVYGLGGGMRGTGSRYDPLSDTWSDVSTAGAPDPRWRHTAVWTGSRMIVWGGDDANGTYFNDGRSYDPVTDTWALINYPNALALRSNHSAVWTGTEMIVWGGENGNTYFQNGERYNPATD